MSSLDTPEGDGGNDNDNAGSWCNVVVERGSAPSQRSLHASALSNGCLYVFGGYDGQSRINDFHSFDFGEKRWSSVLPSDASGPPPSPRDRHVALVWRHDFYVFGGFDGTARVNDFFRFDFSNMTWSRVISVPNNNSIAGHINTTDNPTTVQQQQHPPPSPRHSHAAVVHGDCMYVFGGYDGSYRSDFHQFDFHARCWSPVIASGRPPRARYRATAVVHENTDSLLLFGGHDGTRHLNDTHVYDFRSKAWSALGTSGPSPIPRDSHISVVHHDTLYVFGGSTGSAMNDLHQLTLNTTNQHRHTTNNNNTTDTNKQDFNNSVINSTWSPLLTNGMPAGHRFCHVANVYGSAMYVFGGYDGSNRLNDFIKFEFSIVNDLTCDVAPSTLLTDLRSFIDNETMSDITLLVGNADDTNDSSSDSITPIYAHKIMLMRCPYFKAMLLGGGGGDRGGPSSSGGNYSFREADQSRNNTPIRLQLDIRQPIFKAVLEYLYTDTLCVLPLEHAMEIFIAADQFCLPRLKAMCEKKMLESISVESAANLFYLADRHSASSLKAKTLKFILGHFESVSKTPSFEEMARGNVELVFEILRNR